MLPFQDLALRAAAEIRDATATVDPADCAALVAALATAGKTACFGVGRKSLMMRAPFLLAQPLALAMVNGAALMVKGGVTSV